MDTPAPDESRRRTGFAREATLLVAIVAVVVAVGYVVLAAFSRRPSIGESAAPSSRLLEARIAADEVAAIATVRNIISAQAQYRAVGWADADRDGIGEYGGFLEMSGATAGRGGRVLTPAVLSSAFRSLDEHGAVSRSGYYFRIYLPGRSGLGVGEPPSGFTVGLVNTDLAEASWCCYAWPVEFGRSGRRTFFSNEAGGILATENDAYSGAAASPAANAAYRPSDRGAMAVGAAVGAFGSDRNRWVQIE